MSTKICTKCSIEKPIEEFPKTKGGLNGVAAHCKQCDAIRHKKYYDENCRYVEIPKEILEERSFNPLKKKEFTCIKCGETKTSDNFYYHRTRKCYMSTCKQCNTKKCGNYQKSKRTINDLGYITQHRAAEIRRTCKYKTNRECASNLKDLLRQQWETQKGLCYYTGLPMLLTNEYHSNPNVMTVDRIDPTKGYTEGNIALCCSIANRMKQDLTIEEFKSMCHTIIKHLELPQGA